jgi:hypothetical protein
MDLSVFTSDDANDIIRTIETFQLRKNKDPNKILGIYACGTTGARQETPTSTAIKNIAKKYAQYGITVTFELLSNDQIKKMGWSVEEYMKNILEYDIHLHSNYIHHNMVGVAGASWTMTKIFEQIDGGLTHHLGIPMGKYVRCPCWRKDKEELFNLLPDYCVPTVIVTMNEDGVSAVDSQKLVRFVADVSGDER